MMLRVATTLSFLPSVFSQVMDGFCPPAPGTAVGTVNIGDASTHISGDCTQHSWGHCDDDFNSPACNPENIYSPDEDFVGIAYHQQSSMPNWDGTYVSTCMELGFGSAIQADGMHIMGAASDENVCGTSCVGQYCGTSGTMHIFTSSEDTDNMPGYTTFTKAATISMPLDSASAQGDGQHHDTYNEVISFDDGIRTVKWAAFCRSGAGGARDHLLLDYVELRPVSGASCGTSAASECAEDIVSDGIVDVNDLLQLLSVRTFPAISFGNFCHLVNRTFLAFFCRISGPRPAAARTSTWTVSLM